MYYKYKIKKLSGKTEIRNLKFAIFFNKRSKENKIKKSEKKIRVVKIIPISIFFSILLFSISFYSDICDSSIHS